jgi:hypothetical protein
VQRTLNFTGRKKIEQKQAVFSLTERPGIAPEFNVVFSISSDDFPPDASIYVEAYHKETRQRFCFGTVAKITPPPNRMLNELDLTGPVMFRVLIVDESGRHGMLLGMGDQFRADERKDDQDRPSILSVRKYPLGQLSWKVYFERGAAPELHLNNQIPNVIERMRTDPIFQSLVLPAALREILIYYAWNDDDAEGNEHCERWMGFASMFADEKPATSDPADFFEWVDEVVTGFSEQFHLTDMLMNTERGDDQ